MAKLRLLPHDVATEDSVQWGSWWVRMDGKRVPAEDRLKGWDYASRVEFELQPSIDLAELARATGVRNVAAMDLVVLLDCPSTGARFTARRNVGSLGADDSNVISVEPPPGQIADLIRLSAHVVLNRAEPSGDSTAASRPGSRLAWSETHTLRVEGDDPRFPTEAVAFSALNLEAAAWSLDLRFTDLEEAFMAGVRLLVNTEHPSADLLLDGDLAGAAVVQSFLRLDIARQLLVHVALEDFELSPHDEWPEGSVREVLESMTEVFLGSDLSNTLRMVRNDYTRFERRLQQRFSLLEGARA